MKECEKQDKYNVSIEYGNNNLRILLSELIIENLTMLFVSSD